MGIIKIDDNLKSSSFISNTVSTDDRLNTDFKRTIKVSYNFLSALGEYYSDNLVIDYSTRENILKEAFKKSLEGIMKRGTSNSNYGEFGFYNNIPYIKRKFSDIEKIISFTSDYKICTNSSIKFNGYTNSGLETRKNYGILIDGDNDDKKLNGYFYKVSLYKENETTFDIYETDLKRLISYLEVNGTHSTSVEMANSFISFKNANSSTNISNSITIMPHDIVAQQKNGNDVTKNYSFFNSIDYYYPGYIKEVIKSSVNDYEIEATKLINNARTTIKLNLDTMEGVARSRYKSNYQSGGFKESFITQSYKGTTIGVTYDSGDLEVLDDSHSLRVKFNTIDFYDDHDVYPLIKLFCTIKIEGTEIALSSGQYISKIEIWINGITTYDIVNSNKTNKEKMFATFNTGTAYEATGYVTQYFTSGTSKSNHVVSPGFIASFSYDNSKIEIDAIQNSNNAHFEIPWIYLAITNFGFKVH